MALKGATVFCRARQPTVHIYASDCWCVLAHVGYRRALILRRLLTHDTVRYRQRILRRIPTTRRIPTVCAYTHRVPTSASSKHVTHIGYRRLRGDPKHRHLVTCAVQPRHRCQRLPRNACRQLTRWPDLSLSSALRPSADVRRQVSDLAHLVDDYVSVIRNHAARHDNTE